MLTTALPDILHCLNTGAGVASASTATADPKSGEDVSTVERQRAALKWQQEQLQLQLQNQHHHLLSLHAQGQTFQGLMSIGGSGLNQMVDSRLPHFGSSSGLVSVDLEHSGAHPNASTSGGGGFGMDYALSRTNICPPTVAVVAVGATGGDLTPVQKRRPENTLPPKVDVEEDSRAKKLKADGEEQPKNINRQHSIANKNSNGGNNNESKNKNNRDALACTSKEPRKVSEVQKPDYIHVRARRGQATDSHSLAERVRREKISEKMKILQDLVPGCNKITGKAGMLDEIINYVQSLQRQVEFLSVKLAAVNPRLDFNVEVFPTCSAAHLPSMVGSPYLNLNSVQQMGPVHGSDVGMHPADTTLQQPISAPSLPIPEAFPDSSAFNQIHNPATWEAELQNTFASEFHQARAKSFPSHTYAGPTLKTEM